MACLQNALFVGNSNVVELQALTNSVSNTLDTGATVTCTLYDGDNQVTGQVWPASMAHVSGGTYRATLESDIAITTGKSYTLEVNATGSALEIGKWRLRFKAKTRGA